MGKAMDKIKVSYQRTVNLGNFENARICVEIEANVQGDETTGQIMEDLYDDCVGFVLDKVEEELDENEKN